jgi:hypothetical protein
LYCSGAGLGSAMYLLKSDVRPGFSRAIREV